MSSGKTLQCTPYNYGTNTKLALANQTVLLPALNSIVTSILSYAPEAVAGSVASAKSGAALAKLLVALFTRDAPFIIEEGLSIEIADVWQKQGEQGDEDCQPSADQEDHAGAKRLGCPASHRQADRQERK
jgi:hypothetical protein